MSAKVINFHTGQQVERADMPAPVPAHGQRPTARRRKRGTLPAEMRKSLLAKVHVAKKQLGLTEDEYRAMLDGHFSVDSAAHLNEEGLRRLVFIMQSYGFQPRRGHARRGESRKGTVPATLARDDAGLGRERSMRKIEALLAEKGRVEGTDMPWAYAVSILKRQSGGVTKCFEHATPDQLRGVISALARDARRHERRVN